MDPQQAAVELTRLIGGFQISRMIQVVASLGVADLLKDGPRSYGEIAAATGAHPRSMYRLLHALASTGVLEEKADACFSLTDIGECLRSDSPHSRAAWARNTDRAYVWNSWGALRHSVMTGEDAFRFLHGAGVWDWRAERPEEAAIFDASMAEMSRGVADAIGEAVDFSGFECIVDVGGGRGVLLAGILKRNPGSRGILYDLPHVVAGAPPVLRAQGVADRCEIVGGDMFRSVPRGGDAYVIKSVLIDEEDARATEILRSCRSVIGASGRLIVIDILATEPNRPDAGFLDMTMLVLTGGRERTLVEYSALFADAGFRLEQSIDSRSPFTLLIGAPV
jgi:hypothetical protein